MAKQKLTPTEEKSFQKELLSQLITLSSSGFGVVAALAWNEVVQSFVKGYVEPFFPTSAGIISKLLYALFITIFAVFVTYQLSKLHSRLNQK